MKKNKIVLAGTVLAIALASSMQVTAAEKKSVGSGKIKHVLLLSIDGMHAVDLYNCVNGIAGANGGDPYCPNLAALSQDGINYVNVTSSKPSDSFPGLAALVTGGTPKTMAITTIAGTPRMVTMIALESTCIFKPRRFLQVPTAFRALADF